jgi:uncharacterized membrane protein
LLQFFQLIAFWERASLTDLEGLALIRMDANERIEVPEGIKSEQTLMDLCFYEGLELQIVDLRKEAKSNLTPVRKS